MHTSRCTLLAKLIYWLHMKIKSRLGLKMNPAWYRDYYLKNHETILKKNKEYRKTRPWSKFGRHWNREYRKMVISLLRKRDGNSCGICHLELETGKEEIDHIVSVASGGKSESENIQLITHNYCNRAKSKPSLLRKKMKNEN